MRDLVVILFVALFGTGAALWALSRRPRKEPASYRAEDDEHRHEVPRSEPRPAPAAGAPAPRSQPTAGTGAPRPLATLEFDAAPWTVGMDKPEVVIGRHTQDDIRVADVRVSRHHAKLVARRDGGFEIHNLTAVRSEPNPMLVNGESREHADIADGDVVTLGGVSFKFRPAA